MQALQPNSLLQGGKYKILSSLGQGSFGITYLAEHVNLGKKVAIKEFFMKELNSRGKDGSITGMSDGSLSQNYCSKFKKEAINLSRLDHPNIVRVTDSFAENGTFYYVMDYIDGQNLNDYIKRHRVDEAEAVGIIQLVADALIYMHETQHMLHLDLKPGNVMRRNSDGHIFLIDFGLSKHFSNDGQPETSTTIGLGTAGYAPIEQANQAKNGEFRPTIDVYALGATFYKLLTHETPPEASMLVSDEEMIEESLKAKGISSHLVEMVVKAMYPNVKKRTQTVRDFKDALYQEQEDEKTIVAGLQNTVRTNVQDEETIVYSKEKAQRGKDILTISVNGVSFDMVRVESGTFTMGATSEMKIPYDDEMPAHQVTFTKDYFIGKTEVTQALWKAIMEPIEVKSFWRQLLGKESIFKDTPSHFIGDNKPVENVTWNDCQEFISKLNAITGKNFRLPTEAEWEFAARGGNKSQHYQYSGSNTLSEVAWYNDNSRSTTHDVGTKKPNELGIYDMSGNVWEWCSDWYGSYSSSDQTNPKGPSSGSYRVHRGGSWNDDAWYCRSSYRYYFNPGSRINYLGLRLALSE